LIEVKRKVSVGLMVAIRAGAWLPSEKQEKAGIQAGQCKRAKEAVTEETFFSGSFWLRPGGELRVARLNALL
jgi:hypothetical protein